MHALGCTLNQLIQQVVFIFLLLFVQVFPA
jgi:hypothetical protein